MGNLIVADDEYNDLAGKYKSIGTTAEEQLSTYFAIMDAICQNAVSGGKVFANLRAFVSEGKKLTGQILDVTHNAGEDCSKYVAEIDENDQYLY